MQLPIPLHNLHPLKNALDYYVMSFPKVNLGKPILNLKDSSFIASFKISVQWHTSKTSICYYCIFLKKPSIPIHSQPPTHQNSYTAQCSLIVCCLPCHQPRKMLASSSFFLKRVSIKEKADNLVRCSMPPCFFFRKNAVCTNLFQRNRFSAGRRYASWRHHQFKLLMACDWRFLCCCKVKQ